MGRRPCCSKESDLNRGAWTALEDKILTEYIQIHGEGKWRHLPERAGLKRCGKSCRLRWLNYLRPGIKRGSVSEEEEDLIIRLHKLLGNRWALIAGRLPGRTDNEIKNYWHTKLGKTNHHHNNNNKNSNDNNNNNNNNNSVKTQSDTSKPSPISSSSHDQPNSAKRRRVVSEPQPSSDDNKTTSTVVRTKATRFSKPVTVVPRLKDHHCSTSASAKITEPPLACASGSQMMSLAEEDDPVLGSEFSMDFDLDQSFFSDFLNCADTKWFSELPYSDLEGNISSPRSEEMLSRNSDLESMASLIDTLNFQV